MDLYINTLCPNRFFLIILDEYNIKLDENDDNPIEIMHNAVISINRVTSGVSLIKLPSDMIKRNVVCPAGISITLKQFLQYVRFSLWNFLIEAKNSVTTLSMRREYESRINAAVRTLDSILSKVENKINNRVENIRLLKHYIVQFRYHHIELHLAESQLKKLLQDEADFRLKTKKAVIIQKCFRYAICNPDIDLCKKRLFRELQQLQYEL